MNGCGVTTEVRCQHIWGSRKDVNKTFASKDRILTSEAMCRLGGCTWNRHPLPRSGITVGESIDQAEVLLLALRRAAELRFGGLKRLGALGWDN
jgi:hypothetical protein